MTFASLAIILIPPYNRSIITIPICCPTAGPATCPTIKRQTGTFLESIVAYACYTARNYNASQTATVKKSSTTYAS